MNVVPKFLVVGADDRVFRRIESSLADLGGSARSGAFAEAEDLFPVLAGRGWDAVILAPGITSEMRDSLVSLMAGRFPDVPLVVESGMSDPLEVAELLKRGAWEFVPEHDGARLAFCVGRCRQQSVRRQARSESGQSGRVDRRQYRELTDDAPGLLWVNGRSGLEYANRRLRELLGLADGQALARFDWSSAIHPGDLPEAINVYLDAAARRVPFEALYRLRRHDGDDRWIAVTASPRFGSDGRFLGYVGMGIDVTETKRAERESFARAQWLEFADDPVMVWSEREGIVFWNAGCERAYGYSRDETTGRDPRSLLRMKFAHPEGDVKALLNQQGYWKGEWRGTAKNGKEFTAASSLRQVCCDGRFRILQTDRDISGLKESRERLEGSRTRLQALVDRRTAELHAALEQVRSSEADLKRAQHMAGTGSWRWDIGRGPVLWSDQACRLFGMPPGSTIERAALAGRIHPDDREAFVAAQATTIAGQPCELEYRIVAAGSLRWIRERTGLDFDVCGRAAVAVGTMQDITERRQSEAALRQARADAEGASQAKSRFLATMSHEIRTPLNAVIGLTQLALRVSSEPQLRDYLLNIRRSGKHLLAIVNDILDFSKIEARRMELEAVPVRVADLVSEVIMQMQPAAEAKHLVLYHRVAADVPVELTGDPLRLSQVLLNLLSNAVKFTERGRVGLEVRRSPPSEQRPLIEFIVTDTGIGIAPDRRATLFDAFVQGDGSITRHFGGTGLGLAISLHLARMMGGDIRLQSELGRGSRFSFAIPWVPAQSQPAASAKPTCLAGATPLAGVRLLVVEDNALNRLVARDLLESLGAVVELAGDGEEAVGKVAAEHFDMVLMDIHMPGMTGYEATERIRRAHPEESLPIIAMTADAYAETVQRCFDAGMNGHVAKPLDLERLPLELSRWARARAPDSTIVPPSGEELFELSGLDGIPGLEAGAALRRLALTPQRYLVHLGEFVGRHGDVPVRLRQLLQARTLEELGFLAHRVSGQAGTLGLVRIARAAQELEAVTRKGPAVRIEPVTQELIVALDEACRHVGDYLAGVAGGARAMH
ncbi:MAG: PAS domain S-box protein [Methylococcaceae bacterium]|nr:PAS domain S-box protein [Methylococcaceae bacterium]